MIKKRLELKKKEKCRDIGYEGRYGEIRHSERFYRDDRILAAIAMLPYLQK